jgi:hypothetical protein
MTGFRNLSFLSTAHPNLTMAREGKTQNFALRKGGTKQYVATKKRILYVNAWVINSVLKEHISADIAERTAGKYKDIS